MALCGDIKSKEQHISQQKSWRPTLTHGLVNKRACTNVCIQVQLPEPMHEAGYDTVSITLVCGDRRMAGWLSSRFCERPCHKRIGWGSDNKMLAALLQSLPTQEHAHTHVWTIHKGGGRKEGGREGEEERQTKRPRKVGDWNDDSSWLARFPAPMGEKNLGMTMHTCNANTGGVDTGEPWPG